MDPLTILEQIWERQKAFNKKVNGEPKTWEEKQALIKEFVLHMFSETDEILREINWKMHRRKNRPVNRDQLIEEVIDTFKYWLGIALWCDITPKEFVDGFTKKSAKVEERYEKEMLLNKLNEEKIVGIDIDGVLAQYPEPFIKYVNDFMKKDTEETLGDFNYDGKEHLYDALAKHTQGRYSPEYFKKIKHSYRQSGTKSTLPPVKHGPELARLLKTKGYAIALISSRPTNQYPEMAGHTITWLRSQNINYDLLMFEEQKAERIKNDLPNLSFMIEDNLESANSIAKQGFLTFLLNRPYNQGKTESRIIRVNDLLEILEYIIAREDIK